VTRPSWSARSGARPPPFRDFSWPCCERDPWRDGRPTSCGRGAFDASRDDRHCPLPGRVGCAGSI
jgi:hypothetical protein